MSEFDALMVDELRREFRRTRPPSGAIEHHYQAGIFRLTSPCRIGFRVFWYKSVPDLPPFFVGTVLFELIEPLDV